MTMRSPALYLIPVTAFAFAIMGDANAEASFTYTATNGTVLSFTEPACTSAFTITDGVLSCPTDGGGGGDPTPQPVGTCSVTGSATVTAGNSTAKTLRATCANATSWEWTYNGSPAPGATNASSYVTPSNLMDNNGNAAQYVYSVKATNTVDATGQTGSATITVNPAPVVEPSACGTLPSGTTVDSGFDRVFDIKGTPYYPNVDPGKVLALEFTADGTDKGWLNIYSKSGTIGIAISECPGKMSVSNGCTTGYYNRTGEKLWGFIETCNLGTDRSKKWYFNIKNKASSTVSIQMKNQD